MQNLFLIISFLITPAKQLDIVQVQEIITQRASFYKNPMPEDEVHILATSLIEESGVVSVPLLLAVIEVESKYDRKARSKKGCKGLLQLSKGTSQTIAKRLGKNKFDVFDIKTNLMLGVNHLRELLEQCGNIATALTIYNRGWQGFVNHGKKISGYAKTVLNRSRIIAELLKNDLTCEK